MSTLTDFSSAAFLVRILHTFLKNLVFLCFFQHKSLIVELVFSNFWIYVAKKTDKVSYYFFSILYSIKTVISYTEIKLSFIHHIFIVYFLDSTTFRDKNIFVRFLDQM